MRLFIAVEVSDRVREAVAKLLPDLQAAAPHSRFVRPQKLHLTLQFLGSVEPAKAEALNQAMADAARGQPKLKLSYRGGGAFGKPSSPKVLWIGVEGEVEKLKAIQKSLEQALKPQGFEPEHRDYSPHLTLARAKSMRGDRQLTACVAKLQTFEVSDDVVARVILMESHQGEYRVLHAASLGSGV